MFISLIILVYLIFEKEAWKQGVSITIISVFLLLTWHSIHTISKRFSVDEAVGKISSKFVGTHRMLIKLYGLLFN